MAPATKILVTAPFHHLESSLAPRVRGLGRGDPLAHRRVVVISNRLRDHVHAVLARAGGFAGVEVLSMIDLAREVAKPERSLAEYKQPHAALAEIWRKKRSSAHGQSSPFSTPVREGMEKASVRR